MKITIKKIRALAIFSTIELFVVILFPNTMPNCYGQLNLINNKYSYKKHIQLDTNFIMVPIKLNECRIKTDWRYATDNNFTKKKLYHTPIAMLLSPAEKALYKACKILESYNLGIIIFDAYRPYQITKAMWKIVPDERYAANPAKGSGHNKGLAIDLTLYNLSTGETLDMGTDFDHFSDSAHHSFMNLPEPVIQNRKVLRKTMENAGFKALETEWWHYSFPLPSSNAPVLDLSFKTLYKTYQQYKK